MNIAGVNVRLGDERPLIGVTTSEVRRAERITPTPYGEPPDHEMALGMKYLRAIELAGGLPVVMPPLELDAVGPLLANLTAVCLSGGPDLHPDAYGEGPHAELGPTEPGLDAFELAVARHADAYGLPILAICRGAQALNVARGGSLHQHLADVTDGVVQHRQREPADRTAHPVDVEPDSLLARALGRGDARALDVNSFHHQAAKRLGRGLRAVAWSPDGVIEGVEAVDRDFVVGVQWHAEGIADRPEQSALFRAFVEAARRYGDAGAIGRAA